MKKIGLIVCLAFLCAGLASCAPKERRYTATSLSCFDTVSVLTVYRKDEATFREDRAVAFDLLEYYHERFDVYHDYDGVANLKKVNDQAGKSPVTVDDAIIDLLRYAVRLYDETAGAVNVALGAVTSLWHECREAAPLGHAALPDGEALAEAGRHCDIANLIIDEEKKTVYLADEKMKLDVGAIAKGYAAQKIADALRARGVTGAIVNLGGNVVTVGGKPNGDAFEVAVENPDESQPLAQIEATDISVVTSGSYQRYFTMDGVRYAHIIDPATLYPADAFTSVTVVCTDSALADALSTALFCMDIEAGRALVERTEGVEALWYSPDGGVVRSSAFPGGGYEKK